MKKQTFVLAAALFLCAAPAVASAPHSESATPVGLMQQILACLGWNLAVQNYDFGQAGKAEIEPTKIEFPVDP